MKNGVPLKTIFLDRDGVINAKIDGGYVTSWEEFQFLPGALSALRRLAEANWRVVVVTNQSAVGRGLITESDLAALHDRMCARIGAAGGRIDRIYYCPHRPDEDCACRKPRPGLILRAARDLVIDLTKAWLVGDHWSDLAAAHAAGCRPLLVLTGHGRRTLAEGVPDGVQAPPDAADLVGAADYILALAEPDISSRIRPLLPPARRRER